MPPSPGPKHSVSARAYLDVSAGDIAFLAVADGWLPFKRGAKSVWTCQLACLNLPPEIRLRPELVFTWFGFFGNPSNSLDPFFRLALGPFVEALSRDRTFVLAVACIGTNFIFFWLFAIGNRIILALVGGDEGAVKKISGHMMHGSLLACENCHGCGVIPDGERRTACYPLRDSSAAELRNNCVAHEDWVACAEALSSARSASMRRAIAKQLGWNFHSCLSQLPYFDMVNCFVEDVLHRVALGVARSCTSVTFGTKDFFDKKTKRKKASKEHQRSPLELPQELVDEIGRRVHSLSAQLPSEWTTSLKNPADAWIWYSGT